MEASSSFVEARLLIDKEIARMHEDIRLLQTRRNQLAPASKLPDEILLYIFITLRDESLDPKSWLLVTHICRHWRDVGVGSPSLWTRLYYPPEALIPLMLERSQDAPLDISVSGSKRRNAVSTQTLTGILHKIERIQMLTMEVLPVEVLESVQDVFEQLGPDREASLLESLTVDLVISQGRPLDLGVFRPTRLLRKLYISGGHCEWNMLPPLSILKNLTHLCLFGDQYHLGAVTVAQFLETLRHIHSLEYLAFMWDHLNLHYLPTSSRQPIELPCLRELEILDGRQADLESFLSLLTYPKLERLSLYPSYADVVTYTKSILTSSVSRGNFAPLGFLIIEYENITISSKPQLSYYPEKGSYIHMFMPVDPDFDDQDRDFDFVMDIMSCVIPFDTPDKIPLRHITLDGWDAPLEEFIQTLASLPHLETLEVYQKLALALFKALDPTKSARPGGPIPFQKLRSITWRGKHKNDPHPALKISSTAFRDFYNGLLSRRSCGAPTLKLVQQVQHGPFEDVQISQLKEIGVEVVVGVGLNIL